MFLWLGFPSLPLLISAQKERREQHLQGVYSTFSHPSLHLRCHFEFFNFLYLMPTFTTSKNQQHPSIELYVEMDSMSDFEMSKLCVFQESTVMVVRWHGSGIQNNGDSEEATLLWFMFSVWKQGGVQWRRRQRSSQGENCGQGCSCGTRRRLMQRILSTVCFTQRGGSGRRRGNKKRESRSALDFLHQLMNRWVLKDLARENWECSIALQAS